MAPIVRLVVCGVAAAALLAANGCANTPTRTAGQAANGVSLAALPALPSVAPSAGFEKGGGGTVGAPWSLPGMPGAKGPDDPGLPVSKVQQVAIPGVRVRLTNTRKAGATTYVIRDVVSDTEIWNSANRPDDCEAAPSSTCVVPPGVLRVGGTYTVFTKSNGVTERRVFTVTDLPQASGSMSFTYGMRTLAVGSSEFGPSLEYSSMAQGATPESKGQGLFDGGLPAGWTWGGLPGLLSGVKVADGRGYQGFTKVVTLSTPGGAVMLGCRPAENVKDITSPPTALFCEDMSGAPVGTGYAAQIPADAPDTVVVNSPSSGQNWTFDQANRLTAVTGPTGATLSVEYQDATSNRISTFALGDLVWRVFYDGDAECADGDVPPGFVASPKGYVCAIGDPLGSWWRLLYTQPDGAQAPRLSRILDLPEDCRWQYQDCRADVAQVYDLGWDDHNRPQYRRDQAGSTALLMGSVALQPDADKDDTLSQVAYDKFGRLVRFVSPAPAVGDARNVIDRSYSEFDLPVADAPATREVVSVQRSTAPSVPALRSSTSFDDFGRIVWQREPDRTTEMVWHPTVVDMQLATVTRGAGQPKVSATTWEPSGAMRSSAEGLADSFDLRKCRAANPDLGYNSCAPTQAAQTVLTQNEFDQKGRVGAGLTAAWFAQPYMLGQRQALTGVSSSESQGVAGYAVTPPEGITNQWSVQYTGAVRLEQHSFDVSFTTGDSAVTGAIWFNDEICAQIVDGTASCELDNTPGAKRSSADPLSVRILLQRAAGDPPASPAFMAMRLFDQDTGDRFQLSDAQTQQKWGAVTQIRGYDPLPGTGKRSETTQDIWYMDAGAGKATRVRNSGRNLQGELTERKATATEYELGPDGEPRVRAVISPDGGRTEFAYWGISETPAQSGLANLDQVPQDLQDVPQNGTVKTVTDPTGRKSSMIIDQVGRGRCMSTSPLSDQATNGNWSCTLTDEYGQDIGSVARSNDRVPDSTVTVDRTFGTKVGDPMITTTVSSTRNGKDPMREVYSSDLASRVIEYTDWMGNATRYSYNAEGRPAAERISVPQGDKMLTATYEYSYTAKGPLRAIRLNNKPLAELAYNADGSARSVTYGNGVVNRLDYDAWGTISKQTYGLAGGDELVSSVEATAGGITVSDSLAGRKSSFEYDGLGRLTTATTGGRTYTYGWDDANKRTCAAVDIDNPNDKACADLPGHFDYRYERERPSATTDPAAALPKSDAFTPDGYLRSMGDTSFTYDANGQVASLANASGETATYTRDAGGRITSVALTPSRSAARAAERQAEKATEEPTPDPTSPRPEPTDTATGTPDPSPSGRPEPGPAESDAESSRSPSPTAPRERATESAAPAPRQAAANATTTQVTTRLGYSAAEGGPSLRLVDGRPALLKSLPGGVMLDGDVLRVTNASGTGTTLIDASGRIPPGATRFDGPFGEGADSGRLPLEQFSESGARTVSAQWASFLQPDPTVLAGGPQYAFTPGDPINYSDPTGFLFERRGVHPFWQVVINFLVSSVITIGIGFTVDKLVTKVAWFRLAGPLQKVAVKAIYLGSNLGFQTLALAMQNRWDLSNVTWYNFLASSMWSVLGMWLGYLSWRSARLVGDPVTAIQNRLIQLADEFNAVGQNVGNQLANHGQQVAGQLVQVAQELGEAVNVQVTQVTQKVQQVLDDVAATKSNAVTYGSAFGAGFFVGQVVDVVYGTQGMGVVVGGLAVGAVAVIKKVGIPAVKMTWNVVKWVIRRPALADEPKCLARDWAEPFSQCHVRYARARA